MAQQRTGRNGGKTRATCTQMLTAMVMIVALIIGGVLTITKSLGSVGWPHVAGTITESETDEDGGGWVAYSYAVGDRPYTGHRISYWINSNVRGRYPVGSAVDVYYAPEKPAEAVLEPGLGKGLVSMLGCMALPVILVALAVAWVVLRSLPALLQLRRALAGRRQL